MRILIATVGSRAQQWDGLFTALVARTDVDLCVYVADASAQTDQRLGELATRHPHFRYHSAPALLGESVLGHGAATLVPPRGGRALKAWRPDVLHLLLTAGHALTAQVLGWRRRYWPETPVTLYAGHHVATRFPVPFRWWERQAFSTVACAFPTSPAAEDVLRTKGYEGPAHVIPLGVDPAAFQPAVRRGPRSFTVGFVGDLEHDPVVSQLLHVRDRLGCDLLLVGTGAVGADLQRIAAGHESGITVHPRVGSDDLPALLALLASMDVLTLPADESRPTSTSTSQEPIRLVVEAMSSGVPLVTSDDGETPRLTGPAGLRWTSGDANGLTTCLRRIRDEPGLSARLAAAGRSRAQLFGWWRVADNLCAHWHPLVAGSLPGDFPRTTRTSTSVQSTQPPQAIPATQAMHVTRATHVNQATPATTATQTPGTSRTTRPTETTHQLGTTPASRRTQEKEGHTQ